MQDRAKTKAQLIEELVALRQRVAALEAGAPRAAAASDASDQEFRMVADSAYDWEYWLGADGSLAYISPSCEQITGYAPEVFYANPDLLRTIAHPDDRAAVDDLFHKASTTTDVLRLDFRIVPPDGTARWVEHICQPVTSVDGAWLGRRASNRDITERKCLEEALRRSEALYRGIFEHSGLGIFQSTPEGRFTKVNPALARLLGYGSPQELVASVHDIAGQFHVRPERCDEIVASVQQSDGVATIVNECRRRDGQPWIACLHLRAVRDASGALHYLEGIVEDVTERVRAEEALRQAEREKAQILGSISERVAYLDRDLRVIWANRAAEESAGAPAGGLVGRHCYQLWYQRDEPCAHCPVVETSLAGEHREGEITTPDGRSWLLKADPVLDEHGAVLGIVEVGMDITARKQAEAALRQNEEKFRRTFEAIPDLAVLWERHPDGRVTMALVNGAAVARSQGKIAEFLGEEVGAFFVHAPEVAEHIRQVFETGENRRVEIPYTYRTTGETGWVLADYTKANETYLLNIVMDITERKRMEEALQRRSRDLNLLVRSGQALMSTLDLAQVLARLIESIAEVVNAAGGSVWMWDEDRDGWLVCRAAYHEGVAESLINLSLPRGTGIVGWTAEQRRSVLVTDVQRDLRFAASIDAKTGYTTRSLIAVPMLRGERVLGVVEAVNGDFDEEDLALAETLAAAAAIAIENAQLVEQQRRSNEELRASNSDLDAYAHTVAHDLKNPLGIVMGHALLLEEVCDELIEMEKVSGAADVSVVQETVRPSLQAISRHSIRMSNIIDELLLLASVRRVEDVELEPLDMTSIVIESLDRLSLPIEQSQADIIVPDTTTWPAALGHAPWVEAVWTNYISNAIKYGGSPPRVELGAAVEPDGMARFWVRDNGPGLTLEEQARLFSMFTRLDQVRAKGHGLGLSIVQRIIEKLGGRVWVESKVDAGSTFSFTLPTLTPKT